MLRVAICDDDQQVLRNVEVIIQDYCKTKEINVNVSTFLDGSNLLSSNQEFDLIFLDIEMEKSNGIEIAQQIRTKDMYVPIVYITRYIDYWRRAFKVHAFGFVVKPFTNSDIHKIIDDYLLSKLDSIEERITFITDQGFIRLMPKEIYYFTLYSKKKVYIYTSSGTIVARENLSDIYEKLNKTHFYKSRRDCIVNLKYVKKLKNKYIIVMTNEDMVPLAQKKREDFMSKLSSELLAKMKGEQI